MISLGLQSFGQKVVVASESREILSHISSLQRIHVFSVILEENTATMANAPCLEIEHSKTTALNFDHSTRRMTLRVNWSRINRSGTIEKLLLQLLCLASVDSGMLPLHAAGISSSTGAYIFVGGVGAGKTSLAFSICMHSRGAWIANDYLCLKPTHHGIIVVCESDDFIDFRKMPFSDLARLLPNEVVDKIASRFPSETFPWTKSAPPFIPQDFDLNKSQLPRPVKGIFFPVISLNAYNYFSTLSLGYTSNLLLREIMRPIKGVGCFVTDNSGKVIVPSVALEPKLGWQPVCDMVNTLGTQCSAWTIHAPLQSALDLIHSVIA